jgi:hypothetical protein
MLGRKKEALHEIGSLQCPAQYSQTEPRLEGYSFHAATVGKT